MDRDSVVGIATCYELDGSNPNGVDIFRTRSDWPWDPHSLLFNRYRGFPGVKQPRRGVDPQPHMVLRLKKEWSYNSSPPLGLCGRL